MRTTTDGADDVEALLSALVQGTADNPDLRLLDSLTEVQAQGSARPLLEALMCALEEPCGDSADEGRFTLLFAAAERILFAARSWNDPSFAEAWQRRMERVFAAKFPVLFKPATVGIYGVGNTSTCLLSLIERFAADRKANIVFVHTKHPTGALFRQYPIVNVCEMDAAKLDELVIASVSFRDSILQTIAEAAPASRDLPTRCVPAEVSYLLANYRELAGRIADPPVVKDTHGRIWEKMEPFYLRGTNYQCKNVLHSFPGFASRICGVIDPNYSYDEFCGIPAFKEVPAATDGSAGSARPRVLSIAEALKAYLECWEKIDYRPTNMRLDASTVCQLNCAGCYMRLEDNGAVGLGYMKVENIRKLLDDNPHIRDVELSNSGEPFCNPDMLEILELFHERGVHSHFWNGVNFNDVPDRVLEALVRCGVETLTVSIDGVSQEVYEKYRRGGNVEKVFANIRKLNYYKQKYGAELPTMKWQYILMEHNQFEAEAAVEKAKELGIDIYFKLDWRGGFTPADPAWLARVTGNDEMESKKVTANDRREYGSDVICSQMVLSPQINWDGRLLGCCNVFRSDWGINVFETPLSEVFNDPNYRAAVLSMLSGEDGMNHTGPCRDCSTYKENVINYRYKLPLIWD